MDRLILDMTEAEYEEFFVKFLEQKQEKKKFFLISAEMAEFARSGQFETEHFKLVETRPNVFELKEKS